MNTLRHFFRNHKTLFLSLGFLVLFSFTVARATPPTQPFTPGQTLNPNCAPGETNCTVTVLSGGSAGVTSALGYTPSVQQDTIGTVYSKSSWANLNDFTVYGGSTQSINGSNQIVFSGGTGALTKGLLLNYYTDLEQWTMTQHIVVGTVSGTSYGLGMGTNGSARVSGSVGLDTGDGHVYIYVSNSVVVATSAAQLSFSAGDEVMFTLTRSFNTVTATAYDLTTKSAPVTVTYTFSVTYPFTSATPNSGQFAVYNIGGTQTLKSLSISSLAIKNVNVLFVGDSKTTGYYAGSTTARFANIVGQTFSTEVNGGPGDGTQDVLARIPEIIALAPTNVVLNIGRNDIGALAPSVIYANYDSIVSQLQAAGIKVYNLLPLYETVADQSGLTAHIVATYPANTIIDGGMQNYSATPSTVLSPDNVHPNTFGDSVVAQSIIASGYFTKYGPTVGKLSIADSITNGTPGSVLYVDSNGNLGQDNSNFYYNQASHYLGVGTNNPISTFHAVIPTASTNTSTVYGVSVTANDSSLPFGLYTGITGASSDFFRAVSLQTGDFGSTNAGNLSLQPSGGGVTIGALAGQAKLNVVFSSTYNNEALSTMRLDSSYPTPDTTLLFGTDATQHASFIQSLQSGTSYITRPLVMQPNGGKVGIGLTNPSYNLDIFGINPVLRIGQDQGNGGAGQLLITAAGGTSTANAATITLNTAASLWSTTDSSAGVYFGPANKGSVWANIASTQSYFIGNVGIGNTLPSSLLTVGSSTTSDAILAHFENSTAHCDLDPTVIGGLTCTSDMNAKKNITLLADNSPWSFSTNITAGNQSVLSKVLALTPVQYNFNTETDSTVKHTGFIAQDVEQIFPELVSTDASGQKTLNYSGLIPYEVEAIREMNVNVISIADLTKTNTWRDSIVSWFASTSNGIGDFVVSRLKAKDEVCINQTCINEAQLKQVLQQQGGDNGGSSTSVSDSGDSSSSQSPEVTPPTVSPDQSQTPDVSAPTVSDQQSSDQDVHITPDASTQ